MKKIHPQTIEKRLDAQIELFKKRTPKSSELHSKSVDYWLRGVPSHWMVDWQTAYPLYIAKAEGITLTDLDGNQYSDFCLGDTGAMFGHSPPPIRDALMRQAALGLTTMLPSADSARVGELLRDRFGMKAWQITATASDANRAVIKWFRAITGRRNVLVFNHCYHGSLEETLVSLQEGEPRYLAIIGKESKERKPKETRVVEFNDLAAVEAELATNTIACLLAEPVMTNVGMVLPQPGYWEEVRKLTRKYGVPLVIDETHTISSGPHGYAGEHGLQADAIVLGKPVAGGIPTGVYGLAAEWVDRFHAFGLEGSSGWSGTTTTLAGSAIQLAMMKTVLETYFTAESFAPMLALAEKLEAGLNRIIAHHQVGWQVVRVGARVEFICSPTLPKNGGEASLVIFRTIDKLLHCYLMNKGVIITPFHNMCLMSPSTKPSDIDLFLQSFNQCLEELSAQA